MNIIQSRFKIIAFLLLTSFTFTSCSSDDDGENQDSDNDNNGTNGGTDIVATIETEADGQIDYGHDFPDISMSKPKIRHESDGDIFYFTSKDGDFRIGMRVVIDGEGEYTAEAASYQEMRISLTREDEGENNDTVFRVDDQSEEGQATLTITSLTENHLKATFSAILYQTDTGEKATLANGKIDTEITRIDFD